MNRIFHQQFDRRDWSFSRGHLDLQLGKPCYFSWGYLDTSVRETMLFQLGIPWYFSWGYRTLISLGDALIFRLRIPWYFSKGHLYLYFVWRYLDISVGDTLIFQLENPWYFSVGLLDISIEDSLILLLGTYLHLDISIGEHMIFQVGHLDITVGDTLIFQVWYFRRRAILYWYFSCPLWLFQQEVSQVTLIS